VPLVHRWLEPNSRSQMVAAHPGGVASMLRRLGSAVDTEYRIAWNSLPATIAEHRSSFLAFHYA